MNTTEHIEPTHCDTCKASLERGYCYRYEDDNLVGAICRKCDSKIMLEEYSKSNRLRTRLITDNSLSLYYVDMKKDWGFENNSFLEDLKNRIEIQQSYSRIYDKIKEFEKEVWFKGLQKQIMASTVKGVSAKPGIFSNFCVLTYSMCARTVITIEDDKNSVSLITEEDSPDSRMGFQGIDAIEKEAISLIQLAIDLYHNEGGTRLEFKDDTNVNMGF
jgi:hypothetical protein